MKDWGIRSLRWGFALAAVGLLAFSPVILTPGINNPTPVGAYLNGVFPDKPPTAGGGPVSYDIVEAFPNLTFIDPVKMLEMPGNEFMIVGKQGKVWRFDNNPSASQKILMLDVSPQTVVGNDGGMLGAALHPEFGQGGSPNRGYFYIWYRYTPQAGSFGNWGYMRLSRFTLQDGANTVDPASEYVMIQQYDRHDWHNGGDMFFGTDGFLYISVGDEGGANDEFNVTQSIDEWLFSGVLRIDVDQQGGSISHPIRRQPQNQANPPNGWPNSFTQGYYIPNDNPWLDAGGDYLEEFYAIGLRSPHRMTYDAVTGEIWVGDIGQGSREEISIVEKGDNLQWPYREGNINGPKSMPNPLIGFDKDPIFPYDRAFGRCVIGGYVYRGSKYPDLVGKYLFGDHEVQNVWTLTKDPGGGAPTIDYLFTVPFFGSGTKDGISSFYVDSSGEIYILKLYATNQDGGIIYKFVANGGPVPDPPDQLSAIGAFSSMANLTPAPGFIPYTVNSPLWSDRALKDRWIAVPNNGDHNSASEQITFSSEDAWQFPPGTVMMKHFELPLDENNPNITKRLETRFFIVDRDGEAYGLTYKWNDQGTEAFLLTGADSSDIVINAGSASQYTQTWQFPSRQQCMDCHNSNAGFILGVKTRQINGNFSYPSSGILSNQLLTWNHLGMFDQDIGDYTQYPQAAHIADDNADIEFRVRSYIDANCGFCHRPNGAEGAFDGRARMGLFDQDMINEPVASQASPPGFDIVEPGDPANSMLWIRDNSLGNDKMPPLAKKMLDDEYLQVLSTWINGLNGSDPATVSDGWYKLVARHSGKIAGLATPGGTSGAQVVQNDDADADEQKWQLQELGGSKYRLVNGYSDQVLAVEDFRPGENANIVQRPWNGAQNQFWYLKDAGGGFYYIVSAYNGLVLSVEGASQSPDHWLETNIRSGANQQHWQLNPTSGPGGGSPNITYLTDLTWVSASGGWGPVEIDMSNGEQAAGDGTTLTINGQTYARGLGTHAVSEIIYNLNGLYDTFLCDIGVDDETCGSGSVQFEVYVDNVLSYQSSVLTQSDDAVSIQVNVVGANELRLEVNDGGNGISCDHADWADARLQGIGGSSTGSILREYWTGIGGTALSSLTGHPDYPDNPDGSSFPTIFEMPIDWANDYGTRVRGYIHPPVTDDYTFWISSDDEGRLLLSNDEFPGNAVEVANVPGWTNSRQWTKYSEQQSAPISLVGGRKYYVEALMKEGGGGDNLAVAWQRSGTSLEVIPGANLSPYDPSGPNNTAPIVIKPDDQVNMVSDPVSLLVESTDPDSDPLTFSASSLPPGLTIDSNSGIISGNPTIGGNYAVVVSADDGNGGIDNEVFNWTVISTVQINLKVFLEGPYVNGGSMSTGINSLLPLSQPFAVAPWNYGGTESVSEMPVNVVDWVLLKLRFNETAPSEFDTVAAFLTADGNITDLDGSSPVSMEGLSAGNYFVVISQRNHLDIMTESAIQLSENSPLYDFSTGQDKAYGLNPMNLVEVNTYGMISGDGNADGGIDVLDLNLEWRPQNGTSWSYQKYGDYNLDGGIDVLDRNLEWRPDNGKATQVPMAGLFAKTGQNLAGQLIVIPDTYVLKQNYPNPFRNETTVEYSLPEDQIVTIRIYNDRGKMIRLLLDEAQPAGYLMKLWDGRDDRGARVAPGIYTLELTAGRFSRKILMKMEGER